MSKSKARLGRLKCQKCKVIKSVEYFERFTEGKSAGKWMSRCISCRAETQARLSNQVCCRCGTQQTDANSTRRENKINARFSSACRKCESIRAKNRRKVVVSEQRSGKRPRSIHCLGCGVLKTNKNTSIYKTGNFAGEYYATCKECKHPRTVEGTLISRFRAAKTRAKTQKLKFDITVEFLVKLYNSQEGKCALTGIPFDLSKSDKFSRNPYNISVDRVSSNLGYTKDNVRLVLVCVNVALSEYGLDVLLHWTGKLRLKFD